MASAIPSSLDKMVALLKKHDARGNGLISKQELSNLLRILDPTGYWTDARIQVLFDGSQSIDGNYISFETFVRGCYAEASAAASGIDFAAVRENLINMMDSPDWDDGSYAPLLIRLAWHSSGTYNRGDGTGGSNGATMRFAKEANDPDNDGLGKARSYLEPVQAKYPGLTHADLWILAAYVAIEHTGGPKIPFTGGRIDAGEEKAVAPGRLPNPEKGLEDGFTLDDEGRLKGWENNAAHIREVFGRMGLSDRETVALICGGHVYGRCHPEHSGYAGAWVENPTFFSNEYAADMVGDRWQAVMHDTRLSDGGLVPEEVRPAPGKRQYIDLTKYEPEEEEQEAIAAPNAAEHPPGMYRCVSQWVNVRETQDVGSDIIGRFVQETEIALVTVKIFGTAVRGMTVRGGWVSIIGSAGKTLFERIGDLDLQVMVGTYRVTAQGGAPTFQQPGQSNDTGRFKAGEEVRCGQVRLVSEGDQAAIYGQPSAGTYANAWMLIFSPSRGLVAELIVKNYNEQPRKPIKGQTGHQMMLVSDMVLLWDAEFRQPLEEYAEDDGVLSKDFGNAFKRLTELGCPWSADKPDGSVSCPVSGAVGMCPVMGVSR